MERNMNKKKLTNSNFGRMLMSKKRRRYKNISAFSEIRALVRV